MVQDTIQNLSLKQKMRLTSGQGAWHTWDAEGKLPQIMMCDGPHGLRKQNQDAPRQNNDSIPATCFPTESALACSWNPEAVRKMAQAIAEEAIAENVSIILGCGVNMKRSPLCGRNFEYFSEDPYLAGTLAVAYIKAMQEKGVETSLKHFAGNNQETHRMTSNSQIDERALREIYLAAFEMAVKEAKPLTVMASYNRLNGFYACENRRLLMDILRKEWGYEGTVISDWGACVDWAACIQAGMDLEMPDSVGFHTPKNEEALASGRLDHAELERAALNVGKLLAYKYSERHDSIISAVRSFSAKLSGAINQGICAGVLIISGIYAVSQQITDLEIQSGKGEMTSAQVFENAAGYISTVGANQMLLLRLGMVVIPLVFIVGCYFLIQKKYKISEQEYDRMVAAINAEQK